MHFTFTKVLSISFIFMLSMALGQSKVDYKRIEEINTELEIFLYDKELSKAYAKIKRLETRISDQQKTDLEPIVLSFYSYYYLASKKYDKAYEFARNALQKSMHSNENQTKAYANLGMGIYYHTLNDYASLSEYALKALDYAKYSGNHKLLGDIYYRLYCVHTEWDDLETDVYAQKAIQEYQKTNDLNGLSNAYNAKMFGMINHYRETKKSAYQDSIEYYLRKGFSVFDNKPNTFRRTRAVAALNMADFLKNEYIDHQKYAREEAIDSVTKYLRIVDNIPERLDTNFALKANSYNIKGTLAMHHKDIVQAEEYYLSSLRNLQKATVNASYYSLYNAADNLINLYTKQNNYEKAFTYLELRNEYRDKIYDEKQRNAIRTLEAKFENKQIKNELKVQKEINESKKRQLWLTIGLLLLSFGGLLLLYFYSKKRLLARKQKLDLIALEKEQALHQIKLEEEKNARLAAEQKIIALEKERLSKKVMANTIQIERKNELLQEIQQKINAGEITFSEIKNSLKLEKHTEQSINRKIDELEAIDPKFFHTLKEISNDKLSDLDLRYCAYLSLGLSNKEIATHLNVEQKSVRMSKYRIKKKLNLEKEVSIESYLHNLKH